MTNHSPEQSAGCLSRLYFSWVQPTLKRGMREPLTVDTLLPLNEAESPAACDRAFAAELAANAARSRPVLRGMWRLHRRTFLGVFGLSLVHVAATIGSPLILRQFLLKVAGGAASQGGAFWAGLLFVSALTTSMTAHHIFHRLLKLVVRVRSALVAAVYRKAMALTVAARQAAPAGQIINLMGTDAQKFVNCLYVIQSVWIHPMQLAFVLVALYWILGPAALAGAVLLVIFLVVSSAIARLHVRAREQLVRHSDDRVGVMNEILMSIRVIKFYAWERSFTAEVQAIRAREVSQLTRIAYLSAISTMLFLSAPIVVAVVTFAAFVLAGHGLNAADVFSSLALFSVLRQAMVQLPDVVTGCLEANVATRRLETFLALPELPPRPVSRLAPGAIEQRRATYEWVPGAPAIRDLDLSIRPGELVCVVGAVGAGKSALMAALLGDLTLASGQADLGGTVSYVSQQAWIMNDTIRSNILFGEPYDPDRYARALAASCLAADLATFPLGDLTEIGERGVNLSGGQRQRISLGRAVYLDADVVLLDDPLSALDNMVGQAVYERCVLGALRGRTRILATHRLEFVSGADRVLVLDDGRVVEEGTPAALRRQSERFAALWSAACGHGDRTAAAAPAADLVATSTGQSGDVSGGPRLMTDEERNTGGVGLDVYKLYLAAFAPGVLAWGIGGVFVLKEILTTGTDSWLAFWSSATTFNAPRFLVGYLILGLLACGSTLWRSLFISLRGLVAGTDFHRRILTSMVAAPMGFFEGTPVGRVLNRFSRDMEAIDQQIPRSLHEALGCIFGILTTVAVIVAVSPVALVAILPIALVYYQVQRYFRPTSREGQRLDSITRSPIFAQFSESLAGVQVIRAFASVPRFERELLAHLEINSRSFYTIISANRWLGTRIETLGAAIVAAAAFASTLATSSSGAGFVGLSVTYALAITGAMNWAVRMFSQLESNLNSVERIDYYTKIAGERWQGEAAPAAWPATGHIVLDQLELTYRPGLAPVLRGVSCEIRAGEKIGVVGRTGAGKSSLLLALFRVVEPSGGRIMIDGIDTATLALADLRAALAIIPQEPVLFRGSLRKNLDPFGRCSDLQLWDALARAELDGAVRRLEHGLDANVYDGGSNFSIGQRQLLCLARAVLKKSRILLLDEATASVDAATDALIQRTLRSEFARATVITIAHRLGTVMDSDRIMVLDGGRIIEIGTPRRLAADRGGAFAALLREDRLAAGPAVAGT